MDGLVKLLTGESGWLFIPALLVCLALGPLMLFWPTVDASLPRLFGRPKRPMLLSAFQRLSVRFSGLCFCLSGLLIASTAGTRFTGDRFLAAFSRTLAALLGVIVLSELLLFLVKNPLEGRLDNMSPEQAVTFEKKSSQVAIYVLAGILLLTIAVSSFRA